MRERDTEKEKESERKKARKWDGKKIVLACMNESESKRERQRDQASSVNSTSSKQWRGTNNPRQPEGMP